MKIQVNKKNVGLRIKHIRLRKGYELQQFGNLLGEYKVDKSSVFGWENGRSLPNKERIKAIAKLGDLTVNELLYGSIEEFITENYNLIVTSNYDKKTSEHILNTYSVKSFLIFYERHINTEAILNNDINNIDLLFSNLSDLLIDFIDFDTSTKFINEDEHIKDFVSFFKWFPITDKIDLTEKVLNKSKKLGLDITLVREKENLENWIKQNKKDR